MWRLPGDANALLPADGDTTEEDVPELPSRRKQLHVRRVSKMSESSDSDTDQAIKSRRGRPRVGRFDLDTADEKPIAVMHPVTRKLIIFTPEKARGFDLSPESFRGLEGFLPAVASQASPIAKHSHEIMMAAMVSNTTFADFLKSYPFGPEEAFVPPVDLSTGAEDDDSDGSGPCGRADPEVLLNIEDFVQFGDESSDEDQEQESGWDDGADVDAASMPGRRPSTAASASSDGAEHPLFTHFDKNSDAVGAFRLNQVNQQLILSEAASIESLSFSNGYSIGTLKGVKSGSLETITAPLTPPRRRKSNDFNKSPLDSVLQKRKASDGVGSDNHKRHRSISDVRNIAL